MDKHDKIPVKMFDETQFSVWKYPIEIVFEAKKVLRVVCGLEKRPIPVDSEYTLEKFWGHGRATPTAAEVHQEKNFGQKK